MALLNFHSRFLLYTVLLIATGLLLRYWIGKRRFDRKNVAGLQNFTRYRNAVIILTIENIVVWIANLLIVAGVALYYLK
jgi:hypothetical protein